MATKSILTYLSEKGLKIQDKGAEIITHCVFNDCDKDSKGNEAHLYFSSKTGQYQCKKCQAEWNMFSLMQHFWDDPKEECIEGYCKEEVIAPARPLRKKESLTDADVIKYHKALPESIREYLRGRWLSDETINNRELGFGSFYWENWIVIPVRSADNNLLFLKLRRDPSSKDGAKYKFYPSWVDAALYGANNLNNNDDFIVICEGEFDQMVLLDQGLVSITSTGWATTFKDAWVEKLQNLKEVYICFDNDEAGKAGALKLANKIKIRFPHLIIKNITIPDDMWKDVSEYFCHWGTRDALMEEYCEEVLGVNASEFPPMFTKEIAEVLSDTIKHDDINKVLVFLACVSAFTDDSQLNILLNAPSSAGKTFIPLQIASYFPADSVIDFLVMSKQAFFHDIGEYNSETRENHIDLSRKIIIYLDQPGAELLSVLRPLFSHDKKILTSKITDKDKKGGNSTKTIVIHWYPVVIYCTASSKLDEQEATRFLLLSPEITQEKLHASIRSRIDYETNKEGAKAKIASNQQRINLMNRLCLIRDARIDDVIIEDTTLIEDVFFKDNRDLQPRDQRDVTRVMAFIKTFTVLNFLHRRREGNILYASKQDIEEGIALWKEIEPWQKHGISPYLMGLYKYVFLPAFIEHNRLDGDKPFTPTSIVGINRKIVCSKHFDVTGRSLSEIKWRQDIEPALENAWLIRHEMDWRILILFPVEDLTHLIQQ